MRPSQPRWTQLTADFARLKTDSRDGSGAHVGPDEGQSARPEAAERLTGKMCTADDGDQIRILSSGIVSRGLGQSGRRTARDR